MNRFSGHTWHTRSLISFGALVAGFVCLWQIPKVWERDLRSVADAVNARDPFAEALHGCLVVVDAGHGGQDSGTSGHGVQEKDSTIDIAKRVERRLKQLGIATQMTRMDDTYYELEERSAMTAKLKATAFVSIHLNASTATEVAGLETYFSSARGASETVPLRQRLAIKKTPATQDKRSELLATMIQRRACAATGAADRGARDSRLYVVLHAACPAVLVECGYLTNEEECGLLKQESYKEKLTAGIAESIRQYLLVTKMNPRRGFVEPDAIQRIADISNP